MGKPTLAWIGLRAAVASGNGGRTGLSVEEKWCRAANSLLQLLLKGNPGTRDTLRGVACSKTTGLMPVGHVGAPVAPLCLFRAISFRSSFLLTYCQRRSRDKKPETEADHRPAVSDNEQKMVYHRCQEHQTHQRACRRGSGGPFSAIPAKKNARK